MNFTPNIDLGELLTALSMLGAFAAWCWHMQERSKTTDLKIAQGFAENTATHEKLGGQINKIDSIVQRNTDTIDHEILPGLARNAEAIASVRAVCHAHHPDHQGD